jgi:AraC-like DNA-binding protein
MPSASDHLEDRVELHRLLVHDDMVLQAFMHPLSWQPSTTSGDAHQDETGRTLALRLIVLQGGRTPNWHADDSMFTSRSLRHLVSHIAAHLRIDPSVTDMGLLVGLSPSHFAKKFRQTTGLSLHRFINRRRISASMELLKDSSRSLAGVALELGFSSQSHFTHVFSTLTCMTPAKYQKQFRRTLG